ncbi:MAG: GNAT family N-acetyltransferase [Gemmatimonadota bacterium]|nr:GNAT family N-acetyltransferase [Gemmatimonadota bacterium]
MISLHAAGSAVHRGDIIALSALGQPLPHPYLGAFGGDALWCRIGPRQEPISGFLVQVRRSRSVPGARILRVERFGRSLHQPILHRLRPILEQLVRGVGRVLRLNIEVFDEDAARRASTVAALTVAGLRPTSSRSYRETLRLSLHADPADVFASLSASTRRNIRSAERSGLVVKAIDGEEYLPRLRALYDETFQRTGSAPPPLDLAAMLASATSDASARVFGVFAGGRVEPEALAAFAWVRSHGDYASYDVAASTRMPVLGRTPIGYPLLWRTTEWAMERGHSWFDLGGVIPQSAPSTHPLAGITMFKLGFTEDRVVVGDEMLIEPSSALRRIHALSSALAAMTRGQK